MNKSEQIIVKLKAYLKIQHDQELSDILEISRSTISSWKRRDNIDLFFIIQKLPDIDMNWLIKDEFNIENKEKDTEIAFLKNELKKIDTEILEAERNIGEEAKGIRSDAIKEINRLRAENAKLLEIIHNLSAKI